MTPNLDEKIVGINSFANGNIKIVPILNRFTTKSGFKDKIRMFEINILKGIKVSNHSWGLLHTLEDLNKQIKVWDSVFRKLHKANHLVVIAAGNEGVHLTKETNITWPCGHENPTVICVR